MEVPDTERRESSSNVVVEAEGKEKRPQTAAAYPKEKTRNPRGGFHRKPGRRVMKEFPLTQGELFGLGGMSVAATVFFSLATFCLSSGFEVYKDLSFDTSVTPSLSGYWHGLMVGMIYAGILFVVLGLIFVGINGLTLLKIMRETIHDT